MRMYRRATPAPPIPPPVHRTEFAWPATLRPEEGPTGQCGEAAAGVRPFSLVRPAWAAARGCKSPVDQMIETTSRSQLRRREAGWEGRWRRNRDPRNTNRIEGGAAWASRPHTAKPDAIKGPQRRCGGCARKVAGLIPGGLRECREMPDRAGWRVRRVGRDGSARKGAARRGEVSRGRSSGGIVGRREGLNAKPSVRTFVLVGVALTAANPVRGLGGRVRG